METAGLSDIQCLKRYFEMNTHGLTPRPLSMQELKELGSEDRNELGKLCRAELEKL